MFAIATSACHHGLQLPLVNPGKRGLPFATPELSMAAAENPPCASTRPRRLLGVKPGYRRDSLLELAIRDPVDAIAEGGIGSVIATEFRCMRYSVELEVPLPALGSGDRSLVAAFVSDDGVAGDGVVLPRERGMLWAFADWLRLSPDEPFVYGRKMELTDDADLLLRFDAAGSDGRLMLLYKLDL